MRKLVLILLIPALSFMASCGGSDGDGMMSQMKALKEVADNAKEMQEEMEANPEASDKVFSDLVLAKMDIPSAGLKMSKEEWERVQAIVDDFLAMDSVQVASLNHDKVVKFYTDHGYASVDEGQAELEQIGDLGQFMIDWGMHLVAINQERLISGKEAADEMLNDYVEDLKSTGYSKEDLKQIEANKELLVKAATTAFILKNYNEIQAVTEVVDSLNNTQE